MSIFKKINNSLKNIFPAAQLFPTLIKILSWAANNHITMISEGSCVEDCSNDAENAALIRNKLHFTIY